MSEELARARWEGQMEARVGDAERRLDAINGSIQGHAAAVNDLALKVGGLTLKVGIIAAIGSAAGSAALAAAAKFFL